MTTLDSPEAEPFFKLLYIGDSGTGKTGSLVSLVKAGYKLKVLDFDNGTPILRSLVKQQCPEFLGNVDVESVADDYSSFGGNPQSPGAILKGGAKAFPAALKLMEKWSDGSDPGEWGHDTVFVLDSLTRMGTAAYEFCRGLNPNAKEGRTWYFSAQKAVESVLANLTGKLMRTNVIVISHVNYKEMQGGVMKGWPTSIGSAQGPDIPTYFNNMILAETIGFGESAKRVIRTVPNGTIDLKTSTAPKIIDASLPLDSGLATMFQKLKEN